MKEIKGLSERLASLEHRLKLVRQFVQDQTDMAQVLFIYTDIFFLYKDVYKESHVYCILSLKIINDYIYKRMGQKRIKYDESA